jgi:hypothetical protein
MCRATRAVAIFAPMMLGTATPGMVVDVVKEVVDVVGGSVVVVRVVCSALWSLDDELPHDDRAQAAMTAAPAVAERIPACTDPSWCVGQPDASSRPTPGVISRY